MRKMTPEQIESARVMVRGGFVVQYLSMALDHIAALEAEVEQARERALDEVIANHRERAEAASEFGDKRTTQAWWSAAEAVSLLRSKPAREPDACPVHGAPTADGGCNCADAKAADEYWRQRHARETSDRDERNGTERMDKESREMASEENGLLPPRRCTSKRCVTYEGRIFHGLGCKLSESFESDPDEKVEP